MKIPYFVQEYREWLVMLAAMILPIAVILLYPVYFQPDDMQDFLRWGKAWESNWRNIYIECGLCAYPFLGTFFSGGIISFIDFEKARHVVRVFHLYLAMIDALNVFMIYFILKKLEVKNPALWAGIIGLLPSSWIGTSYWGQIDGVGQLLILATIFITIVFNKSKELNTNRYTLYLIGSGVLLSCLLLTKQLVLFSLASLGAMVLTNLFLYAHNLKNFFFSTLIFLISFITPTVFIDLVLEIPAPYASHVFYVLEIGSRIGNIISSYGFNIWILFYPDTLISSHTSLFAHDIFSNIEFSPYWLGICLFLLSNGVLLFFVLRHIHKLYNAEVRFFRKSDILLWLFQLSFLNLSFNIFLTGTHERYLYHFYPFIIITFLASPFMNRNGIYILITGALLYGSFLYGYLSALNMLLGKLPFYAMSIFHLGLFVYLSFMANKYFVINQTTEDA